eukprot:6915198-Pyramimonas_sp.AAC.1
MEPSAASRPRRIRTTPPWKKRRYKDTLCDAGDPDATTTLQRNMMRACARPGTTRTIQEQIR